MTIHSDVPKFTSDPSLFGFRFVVCLLGNYKGEHIVAFDTRFVMIALMVFLFTNPYSG